MNTTRRSSPLALAVGGLGVAAWILFALYLWQSKAPSLDLPHIDVASTYAESAVHRAQAYDRGAARIWLLGIAIKLVVFYFYARRGAAFAKESAAGPVGTGMLVGMIGFSLLWIAQIPTQVLQVWWDRSHDVSTIGYVAAILGGWLALGFGFISLCITLAIVMGLGRWLGDRWWIAAAPVFVGMAMLFAFVMPYLEKTHKIEDPALAASVTRLEKKVGIGDVRVRVQIVSDETSAPNAFAEGIGPSRRVVLWDTLLDGRFSPGEVRVVLAHEFGHVKRNHIWKSIGWMLLFALPGAYIIGRVARRRGGMGEPASVPLVIFAGVILTLVSIPIQNAVTRHMEAEADWIALETTHDPADAKSLFKAFVSTARTDPDPPTWEYLMFENHPTVDQRIAMVEAWQARQKPAP